MQGQIIIAKPEIRCYTITKRCFMKKLITLILTVALCACLSIPFAGCETYNSDDEWIEVQSITYTTEDGTKTLTSTYQLNISKESIEQAEFDSAPTENKLTIPEGSWGPTSTKGEITSNRTEFKANFDKRLGIPEYYCLKEVDTSSYLKLTLNSYKLIYVKVMLLEDNAIEIKYEDKHIKILPSSYEIKYFEN